MGGNGKQHKGGGNLILCNIIVLTCINIQNIKFNCTNNKWILKIQPTSDCSHFYSRKWHVERRQEIIVESLILKCLLHVRPMVLLFFKWCETIWLNLVYSFWLQFHLLCYKTDWEILAHWNMLRDDWRRSTDSGQRRTSTNCNSSSEWLIWPQNKRNRFCKNWT